MIKQIYSFIRSFGLYWALRILIIPRIKKSVFGKDWNVVAQKPVNDFVQKAIKPVVIKYKKGSSTVTEHIPDDCPIWVCWWQGEEQMPEISKYCIQSIRNNCRNHPVIFISEDNYQQYVNLPSFFLDRLKKGEISVTHFTDVLRVNLICQNGGLWLDTAIWMLKPIDFNGLSFYSNKNLPKDNKYISNYRWTGGVLAGTKDSILFSYLCDCYDLYWKKYNKVINYMLMDFFIAIGYESIPAIYHMINAVPFNNPNFYALKRRMNEAYDEQYMQTIIDDTNILSLNRKLNMRDKDVNGNITYYGHLKSSSNH